MLNNFFSDVIFRRLRPHKNVVQFFGVCFGEDTCYMVFEFLEGGGLDEYLKTKVVDFARIVEIIQGLAAGMFHLTHERIGNCYLF